MLNKINLDAEKFQNKLIIFEGPHGSGKSTQAKETVKTLIQSGVKTIFTKEPYNNKIKELIRSSNFDEINSPVLMYLLAADRYIHCNAIKKWLSEETCVICDRYILSSLVYQNIQGFTLETILKNNYFIIKPNLTIGFNLSLNEREKRLVCGQRKRQTLFFKKSALNKEQKLYSSIYEKWDESKFGKLVIVNSDGNIDDIQGIIQAILRKEFS